MNNDEDDLMYIDDSDLDTSPLIAVAPWIILIVDDDKDVHVSTR